MATVERSFATKHPAVHSQPSLERKLVGRIGPWQLVRLINESELARVYIARPAEGAADGRAIVGGTDDVAEARVVHARYVGG